MNTLERFPAEALAQHIACLGKTGSGKTSTAKKIVEQVVAEGARVCVLDTLKSDWWGLTSSRDGKREGLPFAILGGPHGHMPLHADAGKALGKVVGRGELPRVIIDMAQFEAGGVPHFFKAFAQALLANMRGVLYLVIEEAHEIAPKERSGVGDENMSIYWAKKLATAGRSRGIRLIVCTQRTQALHNAVLGSCDTLLAHRMTAPADQKPVIDWLKANVQDKNIREQVTDSLSALKTGETWMCSSEAALYDRVKVGRITTFDNTATPTDDIDAASVKSAAIDIDALRSIIGEAVKADDDTNPVKLRERIRELEGDVSRLRVSGQRLEESQAAVAEGQAAIDANRAHSDGYQQGRQHGFGEGVQANHARLVFLTEYARDLLQTIRNLVDIAAKARDDGEGRITKLPPTAEMRPALAPKIALEPKGHKPTTPAPIGTHRAVALAQLAASTTPAPKPKGNGTLTGAQLEMLQALRWWGALGQSQPTRAMLAGKLAWKVKGSHLKNRLAELKGLGMILREDDKVWLTPSGYEAAPLPESLRTVVDSVNNALTGAQRELFAAVLARPGRDITRDELAEALGWPASGSHLKNRTSELLALAVIDRPRSGVVRLAPWVR